MGKCFDQLLDREHSKLVVRAEMPNQAITLEISKKNRKNIEEDNYNKGTGLDNISIEA